MGYDKTNKLHIVAVTAVIRRDDGKYLVFKRSEREIAHPGKWSFLGGKVENNASVDETLQAEAQEEAGLRLKPGKISLKDATFVRPDNQTVKVFAYLCEAESTETVRISEDHSDYRWVTAEELRDLDHVGIEPEVLQAERILALPEDVRQQLMTASQRDD